MRLLSSAIALLLAVCTTANAAAMLSINNNFGQVNSTGVDWVGYVIELESGATFDVGSASSSVFTLVAINSGADTLTFSGGTVVPTALVTFSFDVLVVPEANGSFKMPAYSTIAVPEPAIMSMLGLGAIGVIRKRR